MIALNMKIKEVNHIAVYEPVVDITQGTCKYETERYCFCRRKGVFQNNKNKHTGDKDREGRKNIMGIFMPAQ